MPDQQRRQRKELKKLLKELHDHGVINLDDPVRDLVKKADAVNMQVTTKALNALFCDDRHWCFWLPK